jgi:hypothetical protein
MTQPKPNVVEVVRLRPEIYMQLEKKFSRPIVTDATTPIGVGYALGVEAVLKEIRNGITLV